MFDPTERLVFLLLRNGKEAPLPFDAICKGDVVRFAEPDGTPILTPFPWLRALMDAERGAVNVEPAHEVIDIPL